ncbi:MAG TPA: DUF1269 domain-containing protein [Noviherbaspirillum sp.]|jgi:hypothetical protein|uniref:DUF1269 domain-containing protein n=1 Tax=Noviherbaspirillum sp. TaxID=1926288 RepID=UPI002F92FDD2
MRHRVYYLLPDLDSARKAMDELLLSRIEARHIRFMTNGKRMPDDMPEATVFQKTDIIHGAGLGMIAGGLLGMALGAAIVLYFDVGQAGMQAAVVVIATLCGLLFGGWAASLAAAAIPNTRFAPSTPSWSRDGSCCWRTCRRAASPR